MWHCSEWLVVAGDCCPLVTSPLGFWAPQVTAAHWSRTIRSFWCLDRIPLGGHTLEGLFDLPFLLSCSPRDQLGGGVAALVSGLLSHGPLSELGGLEKMLVFCHDPQILGRGACLSPGSTICFLLLPSENAFSCPGTRSPSSPRS